MTKILIFLLIYSKAFAEKELIVSKGHVSATPIAINLFAASSQEEKAISNDIRKVIISDLNSCGIIKVIPENAFIENKIGISHIPLFPSWQQINATAVLNAELRYLDNRKVEISFILWDSFSQKKMLAQTVSTSYKSWRHLAHKISDRIYERITGEPGYFDTKIIYISESGPAKKRIKRLAIVDQDGFNHQFLSDGRHAIVTPRISPKGDKALYVSYVKKVPKVVIKNLVTGREYSVGKFSGMSFAPRFSPDGNKVVMSIAHNGRSNILEVDLSTLEQRYLTNNNAINTSPSYSPDGKRVAFNSNMNGARHIYVMNSDGSDIRRITSGKGAYAMPEWSPRGDQIAFIKIDFSQGGFFLGVLKINEDFFGEEERLITKGYMIDMPTWAPNGRMISYIKEHKPNDRSGSIPYVYKIDTAGNQEIKLNTPFYASDPDWSHPLE